MQNVARWDLHDKYFARRATGAAAKLDFYHDGLDGLIRHAIMHGFPGSLAQSVEQRTFNPLVAGSSPARPTRDPFRGKSGR